MTVIFGLDFSEIQVISLLITLLRSLLGELFSNCLNTHSDSVFQLGFFSVFMISFEDFGSQEIHDIWFWNVLSLFSNHGLWTVFPIGP